MIKINFIPESQRKGKAGLEDGLGGIPQEVAIGVAILVVGFVVVLHLVFGGFALAKMVQTQSLQKTWDSMAADKKAVDEIMNETTGMQKKISALRSITAVQDVSWADLLKEITRCVKKGAWLRSVSYRNGLLVVSGSVISKNKTEMIAASNIASLLREKPLFFKHFGTIEIESIQRREVAAMSVADFVMKSKRK